MGSWGNIRNHTKLSLGWSNLIILKLKLINSHLRALRFLSNLEQGKAKWLRIKSKIKASIMMAGLNSHRKIT